MANLIPAIHVVAMILATMRMTELFTQDKITEPIRRRFANMPWTCYRCVSVWAGIIAGLMYWYLPAANWPFALSWLYIAWIDWELGRRPRQILIELDKKNTIQLKRSDFGPLEVMQILNQVTSSTAQQLLPGNQMQATIQAQMQQHMQARKGA